MVEKLKLKFRCFSVSSPTLWNSMPPTIHDQSLTATPFYALLKTVVLQKLMKYYHSISVIIQAVRTAASTQNGLPTSITCHLYVFVVQFQMWSCQRCVHQGLGLVHLPSLRRLPAYFYMTSSSSKNAVHFCGNVTSKSVICSVSVGMCFQFLFGITAKMSQLNKKRQY